MDLWALFRRRPPAAAVGTYTTWWWPPTPDGYAEMRWEVEPRTDPSPVGYFWSHQVGLVGGEAAYAGLQTMGSEPTGKIAIFSIWGAIDADGPEYAEPFGGEGTGMSVRLRYPWVPGRREQLAVRADGDGWWRAEVGDQLIGRIRVDPTWGGLTSTSIMWTERYAPPLRSCAGMGHAVAWFGTPTADGGVLPQRRHSHVGANRGCPGSSVDDADGGLVQVMGAPPVV
ncbi:MAG TPA: hypothetical protein VGO78_12520 [Acidimicrobiales bacterium]|nr:hypothetical protein [Acidimicrobiales bacterium]